MPELKKPRTKKCSFCKSDFEQWNSLESWCSVDCAIQLIAIREAKKYKQETTRRRSESRAGDRSYQLRKAQARCNEYIRLRDRGTPCISCGTTNGKINAGHWKSIGSHPELRFNSNNIHRQCERCNTYKSGNAAEYRRGLIKKIGIVNVEFLEGPQQPQNLTLDDIKDVNMWYKDQIKYLGE